MQLKFFLIISLGGLVCYCIIGWHLKARQAENNAPKVVITKPSSKYRFNWNSLIPYKITVKDKEDGNSEYDEIAANEVFLKVSYLADSANVKSYLANEAKNAEPVGLALMKTSSCFNCHAVKNKLIGPSFEAIAKKYSSHTNSIEMLANKVIKGSESVWGTEKMPPHPDMEMNKASEIVRWVLKNSSDPNVDYLPGIESAFHTRPKPEKNAGKAVYILTASYTDHGLPQIPQQHKEGSHTIVVRSF